MRKTASGAVVFAIAIMIGACGGGSDSLSEEEFLAEANAICSAGRERTDGYFEELGPDATEDEALDALDAAIDDLRSQIDDIRALDAPDSLREEVAEVLDASEVVAEQMRAGGLEALASRENPFDEVNSDLAALGLTVCAED